MDRKRGGTKIYCRGCGTVTVCASLPYEGRQQVDRIQDFDLWYFARLRECQNCGDQFETHEVDSWWLYNIETEIRNLKADLEEKIEKALGANELIRSWGGDLDIKIQSVERNLEDLQSLAEKIKLTTERWRFLKITKE